MQGNRWVVTANAHRRGAVTTQARPFRSTRGVLIHPVLRVLGRRTGHSSYGFRRILCRLSNRECRIAVSYASWRLFPSARRMTKWPASSGASSPQHTRPAQGGCTSCPRVNKHSSGGPVPPASAIKRVPNARARHVRLSYGWSSADLRL